MSILSERLIEERTKRNISKAEMAKRLDMTRPAYLYYESGKTTPPIQKLSILAEMFGVSTDYLLGKTDERKPVAPAARTLTLEDRERAIKEWLTAIAQATGNEKALAAIERIKLVESTGELHLEDGSDLDNALLQLQATSLLTALEKAVKDGKTAVEWHTPQKK